VRGVQIVKMTMMIFVLIHLMGHFTVPIGHLVPLLVRMYFHWQLELLLELFSGYVSVLLHVYVDVFGSVDMVVDHVED
jgi:hypothetical protein